MHGVVNFTDVRHIHKRIVAILLDLDYF